MKILVISATTSNTYNVTHAPQKNYNVDFKYIDRTNYPTREKALYPRMVGKIPKMLAWELYPEYDVYIWMDNNFKFSKDNCVDWFISNLNGYDAMFFKHPTRASISSEANFIINRMEQKDQYLLDRAKGENIKGQLEHYQKDKSFTDNILIAAGCFAYTSNLIMNREHNVMKDWYYEVCRWNVRDQVSLPYLLHKFNTKYKLIEENLLGINILK